MQKLRCITQVVIPRMLYQLRIAHTLRCMLHQLNRRIRMEVKSVLHLPEWTLTNWIHARTGLGVPDLCKRVLRVRLKAAECISSETDSACRAVSEEHVSMTLKHLGAVGPRKNGRLLTMKEIQQKKMTSVKSTLNGGAVATIMQTVVKGRSWLMKSRGIKKGAKLLMLKGLSGTLFTPLNQIRGRNVRSEKLCRECSRVPESDNHVISECPISKGLRTTRHDALRNATVQLLRQKHPNWDLHVEHSWRASNNSQGCFYRPDCTVRTPKGELILLEVAISYKKSFQYLLHRIREEAMYERLRSHLSRSGRYRSVKV